MNGLSINQLVNKSNSLKIGSQAGRVNTHRAMDKQNISKIQKENLKMIKLHYNSSLHSFIKFMTPTKVEFSSMGFLQLILVV